MPVSLVHHALVVLSSAAAGLPPLNGFPSADHLPGPAHDAHGITGLVAPLAPANSTFVVPGQMARVEIPKLCGFVAMCDPYCSV